ncbi:MAG TPA: sulfatase [Polyangiaceae bacterium]|nr:sulfatase [Polyangiaceae bacterium]
MPIAKRSRYVWLQGGLAVALLILIFAPWVLFRSGSTLRTPYNLVIVSMDTLRADHLSCQGYGQPTSPNIDALASRGTRFATALSTSAWTSPAHASLFTSRYPSQVGIVGYQELKSAHRLQDEERTLAEILKEAGYDTRAITGGGFVSGELGFAQGFDEYSSAPVHQQDLQFQLQPTLDWIAKRTDQERPFFLFLHFYDCHRAYTPPAEWAKRFVPDPNGPLEQQRLCGPGVLPSPSQIALQVGLYDAEIAYADYQLGQVFQALAASGHERDTLVVFVSDHGEEFKDHGGCDHIHSLYHELVRVPLIFAGPRVPLGRVVEAPVSLLDVAPTILELLYLPSEPRMEGESLIPAMHGANPARRYQFFESGFAPEDSVRRGVRSESAKLIFDHADRPIELYDLAADPNEQRNLLAGGEFPPEHDHLRKAYADWRAHLRQRSDSAVSSRNGDHALDPETKERLRALGYGDAP